MERSIEPYSWKKAYELNVKILDDRHKKFLELVNQLVEIINNDEVEQDLPPYFFTLMDYVENYFLQEEIVFKEYQYCNLARHLEGHSAFVQRIAQFQDDFSHGKESIPYELLGFLTWWMKDRVLKYDQEAIKFLKEKA